MRILLFTGKGGVGKSTLAAGTAALAARSGQRVLVLSTDAAHSLCDALDLAPARGPIEAAPGLWVHQVDAQRRFEESWSEIQDFMLELFSSAGVDPVSAQELTVLPGAEEVLALLELRQHATGDWDTIVLDCAPSAETLRLLALPEALNWYMDRVLPMERRVVKALKPVLTRAVGVPMPGDRVFDAIERLHAELDEVRTLLTGPNASVRLVLTPERVVVAEARRTWTTLSLFGYAVDGVIANRVFPDAGADTWRAGWNQAQQEVLHDVEQSFDGLALWQCAYLDHEPVGVEALAELASATYAADDPVGHSTGHVPFRLTTRPGVTIASLPLPGVGSHDVDLSRHLTRHGDELAITVGSYRRLLTLPAHLAHHRVAGARVHEGELQVRFEEGQP